jgi:hypothetical protein
LVLPTAERLPQPKKGKLVYIVVEQSSIKREGIEDQAREGMWIVKLL